MPFLDVRTNDVRLSHSVGVLVGVTDPNVPSMHVGILFETLSGDVVLLHFATHQCVEVIDVPSESSRRHGMAYHWADCDWLGDQRRVGATDVLLSLFQSIAEKGEIVDYGWNTPDRLYDERGNLLPPSQSEGVTCATFAALAFKAAGYPVVDLASWQSRRDDTVGQVRILDYIKRVFPDRYEVIKNQTLAYRLHPHELAASAARNAIPTLFEEVGAYAGPLYNQLLPRRSLSGSPSTEGVLPT